MKLNSSGKSEFGISRWVLRLYTEDWIRRFALWDILKVYYFQYISVSKQKKWWTISTPKKSCAKLLNIVKSWTATAFETRSAVTFSCLMWGYFRTIPAPPQLMCWCIKGSLPVATACGMLSATVRVRDAEGQMKSRSLSTAIMVPTCWQMRCHLETVP